jgi:hypothetical protein
MLAIIGLLTVTCALTGEKTWCREVAYSVTEEGVDINTESVATGNALACPRYHPPLRAVPYRPRRGILPWLQDANLWRGATTPGPGFERLMDERLALGLDCGHQRTETDNPSPKLGPLLQPFHKPKFMEKRQCPG